MAYFPQKRQQPRTVSGQLELEVVLLDLLAFYLSFLNAYASSFVRFCQCSVTMLFAEIVLRLCLFCVILIYIMEHQNPPEQPGLPGGQPLPSNGEQFPVEQTPYQRLLDEYSAALRENFAATGQGSLNEIERQKWSIKLRDTLYAERQYVIPAPVYAANPEKKPERQHPQTAPIEARQSKFLKAIIAAQAAGAILVGSLYAYVDMKSPEESDHDISAPSSVSTIHPRHKLPAATGSQVQDFQKVSAAHPECAPFSDGAARVMGLFNEKPSTNIDELLKTSETAIADYRRARKATDYVPLPKKFYAFQEDVSEGYYAEHSINDYENTLAKYAKKLGIRMFFDWDKNTNDGYIPSEAHSPVKDFDKNYSQKYREALLNIFFALANTPRAIAGHADLAGMFITKHEDINTLGTERSLNGKQIVSISGVTLFPDAAESTLYHELYAHALVDESKGKPDGITMACLTDITDHLTPFVYWIRSEREHWMPDKGYVSLEKSKRKTNDKIATSSDYGATEPEEDAADNLALLGGWNSNLKLLFGKNSENAEILKEKLAASVEIFGQIDPEYATEKIAELRLALLEASLKNAIQTNNNRHLDIRKTLTEIRSLKQQTSPTIQQ